MGGDHTSACDVAINSFLRIPPGEPRRKAFRCLTGVLTHQEIRELHRITGQVDLRYDLIAHLPVEIAAIILQYLPPYRAFQARRVSRAWCHILSSVPVLEKLTAFWDSGSNSQLYIPEGSSAAAAASLKAEHIDAFTVGHAFSMKIYELSDMAEFLEHTKVSYSAGMFTWIDHNDRRVCHALDLRTGKKAFFTTAERCTLNQIAVSASMVTATSELGKCFVWTCHEQKCMSFWIPSAHVHQLLLSQETVAIQFVPEILDGDKQMQVLTWTLASQRTRSFSLRLQASELGQKYPMKTMLDNKGESFLLFEHNLNPSITGTHDFYSTRVDLHGEIVAQSSLKGPAILREWDRELWIRPVHAKTLATIWSTVNYHPNPSEVMRICYDFENDCLKLDIRLFNVPHNFDPSNASGFLFWEDVVYVWTRDVLLTVIDFRTSTCITAPVPDPARRPPHEYSHMTFGDGLFQIRIVTDAIWVLCFDKNIKLGG